MIAFPSPQPSRIVIVVGVDMSRVSEHLLEQTRALIRPVDEAEVHVVHVVHPESPLLRLARPRDEKDAGVAHEVEHAQGIIERLCASLVNSPRTHVIMHTPVGSVAEELARIATQAGADVLIIEAHDPHQHPSSSVFHRSVVDHLTSIAPCTVLTIRKAHGAPQGATPSDAHP
jgi:nucleotide-binding universal stress UspA family protein